jgi:zona occludens toxin
MINLLLGAPGAGKSYEAVAYHVIPALFEGRKVITNLPLILEAFTPEQRKLLDVRTRTRKEKPVVDWQKAESLYKRFGMAAKEPRFNANAFANVEDYGIPTPNAETGLIQFIDPWRHPESGAGPLYVIDECHKPLPGMGTPVAVEEWFAEHRHGHCDVLLMTQSHGKINKAIKELVQVCYRVRKATHLGFSSKYIRKVLDGVGGTEMNESTRTYDKSFYKYYRSHTQSSAAGKELEAKDIVPIWKHWSFKGAALLFVLAAGILSYTGAWNPMKNNMTSHVVTAKPISKPVPSPVVTPPTSQARAGTSTPAATLAANPSPSPTSSTHPLSGYGLHLSGVLHNERKRLYMFTVSQNGQSIYNMNESELEAAGYKVAGKNDCIAEVSYESQKFFVTCDSPRMSAAPAGSFKTSEKKT